MTTRLGVHYQWARDMADMLMLSVLAYMVGGASVSLGYLGNLHDRHAHGVAAACVARALAAAAGEAAALGRRGNT